jgi:hypothetical protein
MAAPITIITSRKSNKTPQAVEGSMSGQATKKVCDPREHPNALRFHCHTPLYFRFQFKCQTAPRNTQHDAATCPLIESGRHIAHKGPQKA